MFKNKIFAILSAVFFLISPVSALAQQTADPNFTPGKLIDDKVFADTQTFGGAEGIQKFLEKKGSVLANTGPDFLVRLKEPQVAMLKQALDDPEPNLPTIRTAAQLIWDASVQSGLNPQVILVTLNKEQGLIADNFSPGDQTLQKALDHAMGFDCPDAGSCGDLFPGFYYQLFGNFDSANNRYLGAAKSLMKSFNADSGRGPNIYGTPAHVGDTVTLDNTLGGYDNVPAEQTVTLLNKATAALYRFTPHVFNGNYNFWKYFEAWFKYPNGTLLKLAGAVETYIIENGSKQLVPGFVAQVRALDLSSAITVSPTEYGNYDTDVPLGPTDNTIVSVSGDLAKYVFVNNVRHEASDLVLKQRGLNSANVLSMTAADAVLFPAGDVLPPENGTIIRGMQDQTVYLVSGGKIEAYSAYTFKQQKITPKQLYTVPDAEIATYAKNGFVPPLDGSLVKSASDNTVYLVEKGIKEAVTGDIFKNRHFSFGSVATISADEISALPIGSYAPPADKTFFAVEFKTGPLYEFKEGTKHTISAFVAKQRGITPDYVFSNPMAIEWSDGIPVPPRDGSIVKGDGDATVYLVANGQLRPLTYKAYLNRRITPKKISVLSQIEVDQYAKGDTITK